MKLFLASEAKNTQTMKDLTNFVGGSFKNLKIAYIPTASNGELNYGQWEKDGDTWKLVNTLGAIVTPVVLEDYKFSDLSSVLKNKDIIWFSGGMSGYLLYWIRRTKLDKLLPQILDSGTIYVGSSAGSMVCSKTQNLSEIYIGENEPGASVIPGLGLIDFEIYPHYEDSLYEEIEKMWVKGKLYLLKNGETITVVDNKVTVLGVERVIEK